MPQQFLTKFPQKINRVKLSITGIEIEVHSEIAKSDPEIRSVLSSHTAADGAAGTRGQQRNRI